MSREYCLGPVTEAEKAKAEVERLRRALHQLQTGPDTLTQDGLRIVLKALYPSEAGFR